MNDITALALTLVALLFVGGIMGVSMFKTEKHLFPNIARVVFAVVFSVFVSLVLVALIVAVA